MAPLPGIDDVTDAVLGRAFDAGSLRRGIEYDRLGHVTLLDADPGHAKGIVKGSNRQTYLTRITWTPGTRGIEIQDDCTCPLGYGCKHAVAVLLTARRRAAARSAGPRAGWRQALAPLVLADDPAAVGATAAMALEVTVAAVVSPNRFGPRRPTRAEPAVRPMRRGTNDRWIKTGASWRDVESRYGYTLDDADPDQVATLRAMLTGAYGVGYYADTKPIGLSQFGADLWFHLARAVATGVELVDARGRPEGVALSADAALTTIDLTAEADGTVTVRTQLTVEGRPLSFDPAAVGLLGSPVRGLFIDEPDRLRLVPLAAPLPPGLAELVTAPPLVVPPGEVDEFLDTYQPILAGLATVGSSDGSVEILHTEFDGLVLHIDRTAVAAAEGRWEVRYRRGERRSDHPLRAPGGAGRRSRDLGAEQRALDRLLLPTHLLAALAGPDGAPRDLSVSGRNAVTLLAEVVPWFEADGQVAVEIHGDHPDLHEAVDDPLVSLSVSDGNDWFDLAITVSVGGEPVELAPLLVALTHGDELLVLPSGSWLRLDRPELAKLRELIAEARGLVDRDGTGVVRVNRFQTSWWDELAQLGVVGEQSARWAASIEQMRDLAAPTAVPLPAGLEATLRPYQQEGLDWLAFLHRNRLGGILADDMGLGKTVQTLALCLHVLERDPTARFLVVAPTSVVGNWHREAATFAPGVSVATIHETASRRGTGLAEAVGDARIVVTSYALFRIEFDDYQELDWELLLLDEAQFVKNHRGKTYTCVRRLDAAVKIAITGTPLENSLMDLWSLLSITAPGLYPDPAHFSEAYRKPIESGRAPELLATLRRRIAPLMRRRTKEAVLAELPPKTEQVVEVELSPRHARIYQTQLQRERQKVLGLVTDVQRNRFEILKSLTLLRQLSLDPGLVDPKHDGVGSAKLDRLVEDLTQVVAEGHRALVFSQFTRYLARVRTRLDEAGIAHAYLDGRTRRRDAVISSFKDGGLPVFVISLKAGGVGLNLTEADYCFVLDPWWNPAVETQAIDRTHRIGQKRSVMVYRYVSSGTIEEKVMDLKSRKAQLFANVMDAEGALSGALTDHDIRGLLDLAD